MALRVLRDSETFVQEVGALLPTPARPGPPVTLAVLSLHPQAPGRAPGRPLPPEELPLGRVRDGLATEWSRRTGSREQALPVTLLVLPGVGLREALRKLDGVLEEVVRRQGPEPGPVPVAELVAAPLHGYDFRSLVEQVARTRWVDDLPLVPAPVWSVRAGRLRCALTRLLVGEAYRGRVEERLYEGERAVVARFDVDHLKPYNDCFGHVAGDSALRGLAEVLRRSAPPGALLARTGGDTFDAWVPGDSLDWVEAVVRHFGNPPTPDGWRSPPPAGTDPDECLPSVSAGVARVPGDGASYPVLDVGLDRARYAAKEQGRRQVVRVQEVAAERA